MRTIRFGWTNPKRQSVPSEQRDSMSMQHKVNPALDRSPGIKNPISPIINPIGPILINLIINPIIHPMINPINPISPKPESNLQGSTSHLHPICAECRGASRCVPQHCHSRQEVNPGC